MRCIHTRFAVAATLLVVNAAQADAVTDWNIKANDIIVAGKVGPPPANRALAMAHVAVFDAVNAITGRYAASGRVALDAAPGASVDAAVATPFIDTPMHPEYPCAHCVVSASLGAVLQAEIGSSPVPRLATTSPTAPGVTRSWTSIAEFTQEVSNARIYDGVHYRNSTEVGAALGRKIGELVAAKTLR